MSNHSSQLLSGKRVVITGAATGIGKSTAIAAAREGASIGIGGLTVESMDDTVRLAREHGADVWAAQLDVTDPKSVASFFDAAVRNLGGLDGAVNNAGINSGRAGAGGLRTAEMSEESFRKLIDVNLLGAWRCMQGEIPHMLSSGGSIVNVSSIAGIVGVRNASGYTATKHALVGISKTAAVEYAPENIRVNAVCPGLIDTDFLSAASRPNATDGIPARRFGTPQEVAELAVWLLSDRASFTTGAAYVIDGGQLAS